MGFLKHWSSKGKHFTPGTVLSRGGSRTPAISKMPLFASSSGQLEVINHYHDDPILAAKVLDPLLLGAHKRAWVRIGKQRKAKDTKNEKLNFRYL